MSDLVRITLILEDRVRDELSLLDRALKEKNTRKREESIAKAKQLIIMKGMADLPPTQEEIEECILPIYKKHLRIIEDGVFVFNGKSLIKAKEEIALMKRNHSAKG